MKILVDENIPIKTVNKLRALGHLVKDIRGTSDQGIADDKLWQITQSENMMLITTDKGFSQYRNYLHSGILIIRLRRPNQDKIHNRIMNAMNQIKQNDWQNLLVIMRDSVKSAWKSNLV